MQIAGNFKMLGISSILLNMKDFTHNASMCKFSAIVKMPRGVEALSMNLDPAYTVFMKPERLRARMIVNFRNGKRYPNEEEDTLASYTERDSLCLPFYSGCIIIVRRTAIRERRRNHARHHQHANRRGSQSYRGV